MILMLLDHGIFITKSGDTVRDVIHHDFMEQVSGHVREFVHIVWWENMVGKYGGR